MPNNIRESYFAEKRQQNPNYFNKVTVEEIRKNVRRIIRDVRNGNISDQDYIYFTNLQVKDACLQESYENYNSASIVTNALNFYICEGINKGIRMLPTIDLKHELALASNKQTEYNAKTMLWWNIFVMFRDMYDNGTPAKQALEYITRLSNQNMAVL